MGRNEDGSAAVAALQRFYAAEGTYMKAGGATSRRWPPRSTPRWCFTSRPTCPGVASSDGHAGYEDWARRMSAAFDQLEVKDLRLFAQGNTVVAACRLVTRSRATGAVVDAPMTQVVTVQDELIVDFRPFYWNVPAYVAAVATAVD